MESVKLVSNVASQLFCLEDTSRIWLQKQYQFTVVIFFANFFFEKVHEMKEILCRSVTCGIVMYIVSYDFGISDLPT